MSAATVLISTAGWQHRTIRTGKITADANSAKIGDTMTLQSFTEVIDAKLRYPEHRAAVHRIRPSQFKRFDSTDIPVNHGRVIRVPDNYDPDTRTL